MSESEWLDARLSATEDAVRSVAKEFDADSVFLGGSLLASLGNSTSDVDVFVVLPDHLALPETRQVNADGVRVDVEYYSLTDIETLVAQVRDYRVARLDASQLFLPDKTLDLAVRAKYRRDILYGRATALLNDLPTSSLRQLCIATDAFEARNVWEDLRGFRQDEALPESLMRSYELACWAANAFAAGIGQLYRGRKWLVPKLRLGGAGEKYRSDFDEALLQPERQGWDLVDFRMHFAYHSLLAAVTRGWDGPDAASWTNWQDAVSGVRTNWSGTIPLRTDTVHIDYGHMGRAVNIKEFGYAVLEGARGVSAEDLADAYMRQGGAFSREEVLAYIDALVENHVLLR